MSDRFVEALVGAQRGGSQVPLAGLDPSPDIDAAMRVQAEVAAALGAVMAGWKVGYAPDGTPVAAPLYAARMLGEGAAVRLPAAGGIGVELEIAVRLGRDLPPRPGRPYGREEVLGAIEAALVGIEIVGSRFAIASTPFLVLLADNMNNSAYLPGAPVVDFRGLDLARLRAILTAGGASVHDAVGGHPKGDPLAPLVDYASRPNDRLGGLKAGQIVTTGSLNGVHAVTTPTRLEGSIEGLGRIGLAVVD